MVGLRACTVQMLGASTHIENIFPRPRSTAQRAARHQTMQSMHMNPSRMGTFAQPACDRKLLVSCSAQHHQREVVPFTDLATFNPAISPSQFSRAQRKGFPGPKRREQQLVQCRATRQEVAKRQQQQQQHQQQASDEQPAESTVRVPILSGGGGGIFFWWEIGECLTPCCQ